MMTAGVTIAMLSFSEPTRDPRVRRMAAALAEAGHRVVICCPRYEIDEARGRIGPVEIVRTPVPSSFDRRSMDGLERVCPEAGQLLRECDDRVMLARGASRWRWVAFRAAEIAAARLPGARRDPHAPRFHPLRELVNIRRTMLINLRLFEAALQHQPSVMHCNDLDTLLAGFMVKRRLNVPLVYDAHEIYAEQFAEHMRSEMWHRFHVNLEKRLLPHTDGRMCVCDGMGEYFQREYESGPFLTIHSAPSRKFLVDERILLRRNRPRVVLYHGAYFAFRGLEQVIDAAADVPGARFVFRGFGPIEAALRARARASPASQRIEFAPPVAVDKLVSSASGCDVGLNPFLAVCTNTYYALPNKFFEYMMAGLALASTDLPEMRQVTQALDVGELFAAPEPGPIAAALGQLLSDEERLDACRRRAWQAARDEHHWERIERVLLDYYQPLVH